MLKAGISLDPENPSPSVTLVLQPIEEPGRQRAFATHHLESGRGVRTGREIVRHCNDSTTVIAPPTHPRRPHRHEPARSARPASSPDTAFQGSKGAHPPPRRFGQAVSCRNQVRRTANATIRLAR